VTEEGIYIKRILVPIDGSETSLRAAKYAIHAAKYENARVTCIYVITVFQNTSEFIEKPPSYYDELARPAKLWFEAILKIGIQMGIASNNIATEIVKEYSSVSVAIIQYALKNKADLIVIGTRGKAGLKRLLLGSTVESVVRHAHCAVLVVR
jgi:nucleotide-binding universal stress UspA family protein